MTSELRRLQSYIINQPVELHVLKDMADYSLCRSSSLGMLNVAANEIVWASMQKLLTFVRLITLDGAAVCPWHSQSRSFLEIHYSYDGNPGSIVARNDVDGQEPPLYEKEEVETLRRKSDEQHAAHNASHEIQVSADRDFKDEMIKSKHSVYNRGYL
ncbi:predicted protein [Sclerotinia sclerotiorum 1980 UF-70]|uniref:Uncharacterized protein n=1 Tax=Sclerotinia sclerotiorum (strain ATCC 18683 / 1980 / Ss-1) TaxID=665079 RepID=A7E841_SCLS1|nr:predicted protein [Sclerotinia sclerotiorum 1980 UF-70]EDN96543.1 predicted protein [Sclerotinia sclerotiorum 1980 UF-70]